jgi:hypothetical protein
MAQRCPVCRSSLRRPLPHPCPQGRLRRRPARTQQRMESEPPPTVASTRTLHPVAVSARDVLAKPSERAQAHAEVPAVPLGCHQPSASGRADVSNPGASSRRARGSAKRRRAWSLRRRLVTCRRGGARDVLAKPSERGQREPRRRVRGGSGRPRDVIVVARREQGRWRLLLLRVTALCSPRISSSARWKGKRAVDGVKRASDVGLFATSGVERAPNLVERAATAVASSACGGL